MPNQPAPEFHPVSIDNALSIDRPEQGADIPVALFRLLRLVVMEDLFGRGAGAPAYLAGKQLGGALKLQNLDQFLELCQGLKIGRVSVKHTEGGGVHVDVHECVTCAGMTPVGRPLCAFEGGLMAGVLESIHGRHVRAREVTCIGGLGDETCGFDITFD